MCSLQLLLILLLFVVCVNPVGVCVVAWLLALDGVTSLLYLIVLNKFINYVN